MAASTTKVSTEQPPYPSWSEIQSAGEHVDYCKEFRRLHWPLEGEYPAAIFVAAENKMATDLEPFYNPTTGEWHEIADLPLTIPIKISSIKADIRQLEAYEHDWVELHSQHPNAEFVTYGDLDADTRPYAREMTEDGSWEEDSDTDYLIRCCGEERPVNTRATLTVVPSDGRDCVTIRDYVSGTL